MPGRYHQDQLILHHLPGGKPLARKGAHQESQFNPSFLQVSINLVIVAYMQTITDFRMRFAEKAQQAGQDIVAESRGSADWQFAVQGAP